MAPSILQMYYFWMASDFTKISFNAHPRAVAAMDSAAARNRETRTDALNRGIQLYDLITSQLAEGSRLYFDHPDGTKEFLQIL